MLQILLIIAAAVAGLYYAEVHGYIVPGGIIPDLRDINLPYFHADSWRND